MKEAHNLTQSYQNEIGKWKAHQYDNKTMISVTSNYLPKYENLVNDPKRCSLLNNTKMLQIYIQRVLNRSFKVIFISGIIYLQIILLRMNCLQNFWMTHSNSKLTLLRRSSHLECLELCHDQDMSPFYTWHCEANSLRWQREL